jgi:hypothetical protein
MTDQEPGADQEEGADQDEPGTNREPGPADRLAALLETAPPEVRREITAWLLRMRQPAALGIPWLPPPRNLPVHATSSHEPGARLASLLHGIAGNLPPTVDSQVVTIRLPTTRHAALRDWCTEHGFSMAAVVRGLVERFLEEQAGPSPA